MITDEQLNEWEAGLRACVEQGYDTNHSTIALRTIAALRAERAKVERLREALLDYGSHRDHCEMGRYGARTAIPLHGKPCTCGLAAALKDAAP